MVIFDDILQRNTPSELEFEHHPYIQQATQYSRMFEKGPFKYHVIKRSGLGKPNDYTIKYNLFVFY